jgi:hypothetical protein
MHEHPQVALRVAQHLSKRYSSMCQEMRSLMLTHSAAEKLARLILDWLVRNACAREPARLKVGLTQRRDRGDHRNLARNRHPSVCRVQEKAVDRYQGLHAGGPKQSSTRELGKHLKTPNPTVSPSVTAKGESNHGDCRTPMLNEWYEENDRPGREVLGMCGEPGLLSGWDAGASNEGPHTVPGGD